MKHLVVILICFLTVTATHADETPFATLKLWGIGSIKLPKKWNIQPTDSDKTATVEDVVLADGTVLLDGRSYTVAGTSGSDFIQITISLDPVKSGKLTQNFLEAASASSLKGLESEMRANLKMSVEKSGVKFIEWRGANKYKRPGFWSWMSMYVSYVSDPSFPGGGITLETGHIIIPLDGRWLTIIAGYNNNASESTRKVVGYVTESFVKLP